MARSWAKRSCFAFRMGVPGGGGSIRRMGGVKMYLPPGVFCCRWLRVGGTRSRCGCGGDFVIDFNRLLGVVGFFSIGIVYRKGKGYAIQR